jgi:hypothetical protein
MRRAGIPVELGRGRRFALRSRILLGGILLGGIFAVVLTACPWPPGTEAVWSASAHAATPWQISLIAADADADFAPSVHKGRVAWFGQHDGEVQMFLWDSLTGETQRWGRAGDWLGVRIPMAGDLVVWSGPIGMMGDFIFASDGRMVRTIPGTTAHPSRIGTDGRYIVWHEEDPDAEVYLYDWVSKKKTRLTDDTRNQYPAGVDRGLVVYFGPSAGDPALSEFVVHDAASGGHSAFIASSPWVTEAVVRDGYIAWLQKMGSGLDVFVRDIALGQTVRLTDQPSYKHSLALEGDLLVWADGMSHDAEIYMARLPQGAPLRLTNDSYHSSNPVTDGRLVTWNEDGPSGQVVRVLLPGSTKPLSVDPSDWGAPALSNGRLVWSTGMVDLGGIWAGSHVWSALIPLFADVPVGHPYFEQIQGLGERELVAGYPRLDFSSDFRPDNPVWRAQFAKMIAGALALRVEESFHSPFTDLGPDDLTNLYPHEYVAAVATAGITKGVTATEFAPYKDISRAQVVTMVYRAARNLAPQALTIPPLAYSGSLGQFSPDHAEGMRVLEYSGLLDDVAGYGPSWDPWARASRAEVAAVLWALMKGQGADPAAVYSSASPEAQRW